MANLSKEEIIDGISNSISELYNACFNKWASVKDFSLSKSMLDNGVGKVYASAALEVMKKHGLIEVEGEKSGLKYRINGSTVNDARKMAEKIYIFNQEKSREYQRSRRDLTPVRQKDIEEKFNPNTKIVLKKIPYVRDIVYIIYNNQIVEGSIYSISESGETSFTFGVKISDEQFSEGGFVIIPNIQLSAIFNTPDDAASYLVRKIVKYNVKKKECKAINA